MPRPKRIQFKGAWYHIFNRGINRKTIFYSKYHYLFFIELIKEAINKFNIEIHSYCLMKNHYHLLIHTPNGNIAKAMHYILFKFASTINKDTNADGNVFKDRYRSILVDSDEYLLVLSRYIHLNPVASNICKNAEDYEWSSINEYTRDIDKASFLKKDKVLSYFNNKKEYKEYIDLGMDSAIKQFYSRKYIYPILGSDNFKNRIKQYYSQSK
jgi:putative transposase